MKKKVPILLFILFLFIGCSSKNMKNYKLIKQSSSNIADLYQDIYSFDLKNPDFYESKLDLARYYLLVGNYNEALAFLLRAEEGFPVSTDATTVDEARDEILRVITKRQDGTVC